MSLDPDQLQKVHEWLQKKCALMVCPCCNSTSWGVGELGTMLPIQDNNILFGGKCTPALPILCQNCGFIRLFSAIMIGLIPGDQANSELPSPSPS